MYVSYNLKSISPNVYRYPKFSGAKRKKILVEALGRAETGYRAVS